MEFNQTQLTYLDALGIDVWMPRDHVVLAETNTLNVMSDAESQNYQQSSHIAGMASAREQLSAIDSPKSRPVSASSIEQPSVQQPVKSMQTTATSQSEINEQQPAASTQVVPEFHLQFWCYASGFWFVSGYQGLRPEHHKFVHNLALYLQGPSQSKKRKPVHVGVFSWPMIDAPNIDQSERVAKNYLAQHLEQLQQMSPAEKLIVLDQCEQWLPLDNRVCLDTHLDTCLASGSEKLRIWTQLQPHRLI